uniref:Dihydropteridine reductase n=1 Tax=Meloidogyne javanica TaxID=6303 RepID=A0A915N4Y0_MELJA
MSVESNNKNNSEKDADFDQKPHILQLFVPSNPLHSDEHALEHSYIFSYFMRPQGKFDPEDYAIFVQPVARISSVEQFWLIYRFIKRPSDLTEKVDFHLFKEGIKPVWEDPANRNGGKWILRLKKGLSSRIWENLLLAMIGEQFLVGGEVVGAVCSVRNQEDIISLWNRSSDSAPVTNRIRETLRRVLNLPSNAILEYKRHDDCLKDQRSYCHSTSIGGGGQQSNHHHVLIYGGRGALGKELVDFFRSKNIWVLNVDMSESEAANSNVLVDPLQSWVEQEKTVLNGVESVLNGDKLDAILCVAGGWAGGNASNKDFIKNADLVWKQSVWTCSISAKIGAKFLKPSGLLQFTGAAAAVQGTPGMIGYGMAKVKSLADYKTSGLPENAVPFAFLPVTLDTPMNRKWMPKADHSTWTPLSFIAEKLFGWIFEPEKCGDLPKAGALLELITKDGKTEIKQI